jgi:cytochrome c biogenesis protein CcdA/PKD repeat protein/peroxiredoxin
LGLFLNRTYAINRFTILLIFIIGLSFISVTLGSSLQIAPDFTLRDIDDNTFTLSQMRGRVVLLEFFATYCQYCELEIPHLLEVQDEFGDYITIFSISTYYQDSNEDLRQFGEDFGITWRIARDTANVRSSYGVSAIPKLVIVDQDGYIHFEHVGLIRAPELMEVVRDLLTIPFTITTNPRLDDIRVSIDEETYTTENGQIDLELIAGQHRIELLDTQVDLGNRTYRFAEWSDGANANQTLQILELTTATSLTAQFTEVDLIPPIANAGADQQIVAGVSVSFDGTASSDNVGIISYIWTFWDGPPRQLVGPTPAYRFTTPGVVDVTLNVTDAEGHWATDTLRLTVLKSSEPIANAGPNQVVAEDTLVTFTGYASWEPLEALTYTWTFEDNGTQTLSGANPSYVFTTPNQYTITLTVTYDGITTTDSLEVSVLDVTPPLIDAGNDQVLTVGEPLTLYAQNVTDNGRIEEIRWDFGDGTTQSGIAVNHTYLASGRYQVMVTARDEGGNTATDDITITVLPQWQVHTFQLTLLDQVHPVTIVTNSSLSDWHLPDDALFAFHLDGAAETYGVCNITLPLPQQNEGYTVLLDDQLVPSERITVTRNSTHISLNFTYLQGNQVLTVVSTQDYAPSLFNVSGIVLVFTAGVLALFSPCGFPMLPGYISYYLGAKAPLHKALSGGGFCALGLISVFSVIGIGVATLGNLIAHSIPFLELVAGFIAIVMGVTLLTNIRLPTFMTRLTAPQHRGLRSLYLYGVIYGLATLGCSAPIFLSTMFYAFTAGGFFSGIITFLIYALGMGIPLLITTLLVAKAKQVMIGRLMKLMPWIQKFSSILLVGIGIYILTFHLLSG